MSSQKIILTVVLTISHLIACPEYWNPKIFYTEVTYSFLDPLLIDDREDSPLYKLARFSTYGYRKRVEYFKKKKRELNIKEWRDYFDERLSVEEITKLLYSDTLSTEVYPKLASKINNSSIEKYLTFLDRQRHFVSTLDEDIDPLNLRDEVRKLFKQEEDSFLKLRYLFLMLRIEHYDSKYEIMLLDYKKYAPKLKDLDSIVWEWIEALRAGALQHLGRDVESNLLYGEILKNHKTNPHLGYYDFKIKDDTQWQNLFAKLKTSDDEALFYFLRALKWDGAPLLEHREIAKIAPNSIWFNRLSYMIMQDLQKHSYTKEFDISKADKYDTANYRSFIEKKNYFQETMSQLKEPSFFSRYVSLYTDILYQEESNKMAYRIELLYSFANQEQMPFVTILEYINRLHSIKNIERDKKVFVELDQLFDTVPPSKKELLSQYTAFYMKNLYPKGSPERYFSALFSMIEKWESVYGVIDVIGAKNFEKYIEKKGSFSYEKRLFRSTMRMLKRDDVAYFLTTLYTKEGKLEKANHYIKQIPNLNIKTEFNPFNVSLSGNNRETKGKDYTHQKFLDTMLKIKKTIKENPSSAMDHYLLANGLYNSSWFGNFPMSSWVSRNLYMFSKEEGEKISYKLDLAEKEYRLALKYTQDKEFRAKISYQLLKIAFNRFLIEKGGSYDEFFTEYQSKKSLIENKALAKLYKKYKDDYGSSSYGRDIINQCATFRYFR